ncbi:hypothetical protein LZ32DRAFT_139199 [Colletotrichum eremochloae]|nr:hypothetical protein LZ32DRAFT_139199 [Colletotrichum eremochloae]
MHCPVPERRDFCTAVLRTLGGERGVTQHLNVSRHRASVPRICCKLLEDVAIFVAAHLPCSIQCIVTYLHMSYPWPCPWPALSRGGAHFIDVGTDGGGLFLRTCWTRRRKNGAQRAYTMTRKNARRGMYPHPHLHEMSSVHCLSLHAPSSNPLPGRPSGHLV